MTKRVKQDIFEFTLSSSHLNIEHVSVRVIGLGEDDAYSLVENKFRELDITMVIHGYRKVDD
jgi:hypothetical protein